MSEQAIITFTTVLLGSSVGAAIVTGLFQWRSSRREREAKYLDEQLRGLYGPLHYLIRYNQSLFNLNQDYHKAYSKEFASKEFAESAMETISREARAFIEEANSYLTQEVQENNQRIMDVLQENWHLIDPDDIEDFSTFQLDMSRLRRTGEKSLMISIILDQHLGPIYYTRPQMIQRVKNKFESKQARYRKLAHS